MIKRQVQLHKMAHFEVEIDSSNPMYLISISSNRHKLKCMHVYMATVNFQFYKILKTPDFSLDMAMFIDCIN